jgi:hypothetical protein
MRDRTVSVTLIQGRGMKPISKFKSWQLRTLSKPACDRALYRAIRKYRVRSIVEVGIGDCSRATNMIRLAQRYAINKSIRYTGIDLFECRAPGSPKLSLINAHKLLNRLDAKVQLVPGEPHQTISRIANSHVRTDMVVITAGYDPLSVQRSWFYVPRMIHASSLIFVQEPDAIGQPYQCFSRLEIEQLADKYGLSRPLAA